MKDAMQRFIKNMKFRGFDCDEDYVRRVLKRCGINESDINGYTHTNSDYHFIGTKHGWYVYNYHKQEGHYLK